MLLFARLILFLLPLLVLWLLWRLPAVHPVRQWLRGRGLWWLAAAVITALVAVILLVWQQPANRDQTYIPAHLQDDQLVPAQWQSTPPNP